MDRPRLRGRIRVPKIIFIRHGQAQFGQANYDKLSEVGYEQSVALGKVLFEQGATIDHWVRGDMVRHAETLKGVSQGMRTQVTDQIVTPDLNEYDFTGLLDARFADGKAPAGCIRIAKHIFGCFVKLSLCGRTMKFRTHQNLGPRLRHACCVYSRRFSDLRVTQF